MAKSVTKIPQTRNIFTAAPITGIAKRKVAGYARVSTDSDEQFTSYEAQVDYYTRYIRSHPEWEFVYLGVDYNGAAVELVNEKNVHNLGAKNYEQLPKYAHFFDCAMIPFKRGAIAKATSPVKLFEYMASGLPTVCTRDLQECEGYKYVYMSKNDKDFGQNIGKAIEDHKNSSAREMLLKQAEENTWAKRVKIIAENLE